MPGRHSYDPFLFLIMVALIAFTAACSVPQSLLGHKKPAPVLPRAQFLEQIARVEKGDSEEAAQALIKAVPNGETFVLYYVEVLATARSVSGKMNLDPLRKTSEFYGVPPAQLQADGDRGTAILWWAALKLWELPKGDPKQKLVDKFVKDIDMFVEGKRISPVTGMDLAWSAVLRPGIGLDVSTDSLASLLRKYADSPSTDVSKAAMDRLFNILTCLSPDTEVETYRFFKAHKPGERWPDSVHDLYRSVVSPNAGNISRQEYDQLPALTLWQLHDKLKIESRYCAGGTRCPDFFCDYAIRHIVDGFREHPKEVMEIVKSLLDDGLYDGQIRGRVNNLVSDQEPVDPKSVVEYQPLIDLVTHHARLQPHWDN